VRAVAELNGNPLFCYVSGAGFDLIPVVSWRRANNAETAGFARWKLVSGPVLDGETPVCAALSLLGKFRFPAGV
jgi:hypothetical protein